MSESTYVITWPELHWRLDRIDSQHAHVTVFDHGQNAGTLVLDPHTWDLLAHHHPSPLPLSPAPGGPMPSGRLYTEAEVREMLLEAACTAMDSTADPSAGEIVDEVLRARRLYTEADVLAIVDEALVEGRDGPSPGTQDMDVPEILAVLIKRAEADKAPMSKPLIAAGISDKYGQVYVERIGNTGFDGPPEPVALLRAQDEHAYRSMLDYLRRCAADPDVPDEQALSVGRQIEAFDRFRSEHPELIRKPGRVIVDAEVVDPFELEDSCDADD